MEGTIYLLQVFPKLERFRIYITNLVLKWIKAKGGIPAIAASNKAKSDLIYNVINNSNGFYHCAVDPKYQSKCGTILAFPKLV